MNSNCCICWRWFCYCCLATCTRAGNAIFTALEQSQEAIEITSEDQVIQVGLSSSEILVVVSSWWTAHLFFASTSLPSPSPSPLVPPLSRFSDRSCLVIPDLGCDSCGPCPSEWLFLLTPKHCGLCYHTMFSHEIYAFELREISNECACFSYVVGRRHPNCVWASLWTTVSDQAWTLLLLLLHSMWTLPMSPLWATNKGS